jgi:hypothetical protein
MINIKYIPNIENNSNIILRDLDLINLNKELNWNYIDK